MNAQDLKNSILQLAIQGKLVENNEEDETIDELINGIKVSEVKCEDILFDIPQNWIWIRLGEVFEFVNGYAFKPTDWSDTGLKIVRIQNLNDEAAPFNYFSGEVSEKYLIDNGALLFSWSGTPGTSFGAFIWERGKAILNQHIFIVKTKINIDLAYAKYALNGEIRYFISQAHGSAGLQHITKKKLENSVFPVPPLKEQKRIVAKIEELMPYVEKYGDAHSKLEMFNKKFPEDMQKSILQYAIQGKLVEQREEEGTAEELYQQIQEEKAKLIKEGKIKKEKPLAEITEDDIPFEIPESWKWARLGDIVSIKGGKRLPAGKQLTLNKTDHIYIRVTDMKNQTIDDTDLHYLDDDIFEKISNYIIEKSDIYIVIVGSTIGKAGLVPERFHGMNLTENAARLIPICMDKDYLMRYLSATAAQIQFIDQTKQVGQPKLALIRLKNTLVPIPPLKEQKRIVVKIEEMMPYCQHLVK